MKKRIIYSIGILAGAMLGFAYWYYIGCNSGTCPLTSKWYSSSIFGAVFGYFASGTGIDLYDKRGQNKIVKNEQIQ